MSAEEKKYPRVLIVSHPVLAKNTSMGKTLDTYFDGWPRENIAQLYVKSEVPTDPLCVNYFRFTDPDALKSILQRRRQGTVLGEPDVHPERADPVENGNLTGVYNYGRKRTPLIYLARDTMWRMSGWKHSGMLEWAKSFQPEVIFFASGDYAFAYRIVRFLSEQLGIPYVICCFDDYYLFSSNQDRFLGKFRQKLFMKEVRRTVDGAAKILTVNDAMANAYGRFFSRKCGVVWTATALAEAENTEPAEKQGITFLGGLGLGRNLQLTEIADALQECAGTGIPEALDVYSEETDPDILRPLQEHSGIRFRGFVSGDQVPGIIRRSRAVIHTESFDPVIRERVRYSLSTKIADSLASGTCMLAYGPPEAASMDYLIRNEAAFTATSQEELRTVLPRLFTDDAEYRRTAGKAKALARENHSPEATRETVRKALSDALAGQRE